MVGSGGLRVRWHGRISDDMQLPPQRQFIAHFWSDPANFLLCITLPLFLASAFVAKPIVELTDSFFFLTPTYVALGTLVIVFLAIGSKLGSLMSQGSSSSFLMMDQLRFDRVHLIFLGLTLAAHLIYLAEILRDPSLVSAVLTGERGASFEARDAIVRITGVTTLTHLSNLVYCMAATRYVFVGSFTRNRLASALLLVLAALVVAHGILGSERLALVENLIAFSLPIVSFDPRFRRIAAVAPIVGVSMVFLLFSYGEYSRSWAYNAARYDTFWQYAVERFLTYVALAANTGAGMIETLPPTGPFITAVAAVRAPIIGTDASYTEGYLARYGSVEFNNPSGIFGPLIDYGITGGYLFALVFGLLLGAVYSLYRRGQPIGLLLYPIAFVGLVDLTQVWYWGGSRLFSQLIFLLPALVYVLRRKPTSPLAVA